ncbi:peptidoglycan-binding domain-containing protein [Marinibacterium sp. SX1]|uniref:peptidoglycan-binding domain-containing protein n=1 Tax=Marinibacterium sp. SX1 TaxID=3388424 RepID=UPI003D173099
MLHGSGRRNVALVAALSMVVTGAAHRAGAQTWNDVNRAIDTVDSICRLTGACGRQPKPQPPTSRSDTGGGRASPPKPKPETAQQRYEREMRASVQSALNAFGYPVGPADGVWGTKTRTGMRNLQAALGFPVTGNLTPYEQQILLGAHESYNTGHHHSAYPGLFAAEGLDGLLRAHADPNYFSTKYADGSPSQNGGTGAIGGSDRNPVSPPSGAALADNREGQGGFKLDAIEVVGELPVSIQEHCDHTKLTTQTHGGLVQASDMTDPDQALSEQFCDARIFLMGEVKSQLGRVRQSEEELVAACGQVAGAMAPAVSRLGSEPPAAVIAEASRITGTFGLNDPAAVILYGQVCIGLGYRENDADTALAGGLVLVGAGRTPFAEMVGHQLRKGFGTAKNPAAADAWYLLSLDALDDQQAPAVLPSQQDKRTAILRAALGAKGGQMADGGDGSRVPVVNNPEANLRIIWGE